MSKQKEPMTLKQAVEIAEMLKTCFRDVVINGSDEHPVVIAKGHFPMKLNYRCFCGGESIPSSVAGYKHYHSEKRKETTYSTGDTE